MYEIFIYIAKLAENRFSLLWIRNNRGQASILILLGVIDCCRSRQAGVDPLRSVVEVGGQESVAHPT